MTKREKSLRKEAEEEDLGFAGTRLSVARAMRRAEYVAKIAEFAVYAEARPAKES